jgi:hypothetical protein
MAGQVQGHLDFKVERIDTLPEFNDIGIVAHINDKCLMRDIGEGDEGITGYHIKVEPA